MAPTFNIAVVLLVTLQLAQQASLSNKFYDTKDLNSPLDKKLTFHSRFNVLSSLKSKQSVRREPQVKSKVELNHLNVERESVSRFRSKRQLDQEESDAEVFSNDPKMSSYGKSMPMTTTDDETDEHQHEKPESDSWNEDVDTTNKNSLEGLEDKPKEEDETTNGEQDSEISQSKLQASTFHSQFQDISSADHDMTPKMTGEDTLSASSPQTPQSNSTEIPIGPVSIESDHKQDGSKSNPLETDTELHDNAPMKDDNDKDTKYKAIISEEVSESNLYSEDDREDTANTEGEPKNIEMEKDEIVHAHEEIPSSSSTSSFLHLKQQPAALDEEKLSNEKDVGQRNRESEEVISKEFDIDEDEDEDEGEPSKHLDNEEVDVFMAVPVDDSSSRTSGQMKLHEDIADYSKEGSGDMESDPTGSHETNNMHENSVTNITDNTASTEIPPAMDNMNFNIDSDTDKPEEENETEDEYEDEKEIEPPIADPTEIVSEANDPSKTNVLSDSDDDEETHEEKPLPDPTGNSSNKDDPSLTYDRNTIINPFNMDNVSEITRHIGKAIGILDSSEEEEEEEKSEGSGEPFLFHDTELDKNSLENDGLFKTDPGMLNGDTQTEDYIDTTTTDGDLINKKEVVEEPVVIRHHDDLLNAAVIPENEDDTLHVTQDPDNDDKIEENGKEIAHLPIDDTIAKVPLEHEHGVVDHSSSFENGSVLPLPAGINEMGIQNGEKVVTSPENEDETSSSSTGSFIVLGAIMATIVALLGYSVIKSYRQKQETSRRPPKDEIGTELKEIDTLIPAPGRNGHGPANRLNVESDRLLGPSSENDVKPDGRYPIYQNGFHGGNGITDKPTNVLQVDDPNDLSEVKVNSHKTFVPDSPDTLIPQVANGLKSSPGHSDNNKPGAPKSPSADDRGSWGYGNKPETAKIKMFIDHDSIPKTPIVIVKRGPATLEM